MIILDTKKSVVKETGKFLGECTNNFAEYSALSLALSAAKKLGGTELSIFSDSELLVRQFNGDYKIKKPELRAFMPKILKQASFFRRVALAHIPRELNSHADKLVNRVLNRGLACTPPSEASYPQARKQPGERRSAQLTLPLSRCPRHSARPRNGSGPVAAQDNRRHRLPVPDKSLDAGLTAAS